MSLEKNREEIATFEVSFLHRLNANEALSNPVVRIEKASLYEWTDVTSEVLNTGSAAVAGLAVQFSLIAGAGTTQLPGTYRIVVNVDTSQNQHLVGIVPLNITG